MPKKKETEIKRFPHRVLPKHMVHVRGIEYKEGEVVDLSSDEIAALTAPDGSLPLVAESAWASFTEAYAAGSIDHTGKPIPQVPEAEGEPEAGE